MLNRVHLAMSGIQTFVVIGTDCTGQWIQKCIPKDFIVYICGGIMTTKVENNNILIFF